MAGRTPIRPGEIGSVYIAPSGARFRGRARTRDAGGALHRLSATADTREDVRGQLERKAAELAFTANRITSDTRMGLLLDLWLDESRERVKYQTQRVYADTVRWLVPMVGALGPDELDT